MSPKLINNGELAQRELHIYGSSRLGLWKANRDVQSENWWLEDITPITGTGGGQTSGWERGQTVYELSNHLGNVLVTISDKKIGIDNNSDGTIDYYTADVITATDYAPFGSQLAGRTYSANGSYRYGFNGKEKDNEVSGDGNLYDYGFRNYDPRLGRFLSIDPLTDKYPFYTPYQYAGNSPVRFIDVDGLEPATDEEKAKAKSKIDDFEKNDNTKQAFKNISKKDLISQLRATIDNPDLVNQTDGTYLCGPAAIMRVMGDWTPENYVDYALGLYQNGEVKINDYMITATDNLRNAKPENGMRALDFMTMTALRESENNYNKFDAGDTKTPFFAATINPTEKKWITNFLGLEITKAGQGLGGQSFSQHINSGYGAILSVSSKEYNITSIGTHFIFAHKPKGGVNAYVSSTLVSFDYSDYGATKSFMKQVSTGDLSWPYVGHFKDYELIKRKGQ